MCAIGQQIICIVPLSDIILYLGSVYVCHWTANHLYSAIE